MGSNTPAPLSLLEKSPDDVSLSSKYVGRLALLMARMPARVHRKPPVTSLGRVTLTSALRGVESLSTTWEGSGVFPDKRSWLELREYTTDMPRLLRVSILSRKDFVPGGANTTKSDGGASGGRVDESVSLSSAPFSLLVSCLS